MQKHPKSEILISLLKAALDAKEQQGEIAAEFAADKRQAIEDHNLHPRAFSLCVALKRMDQVKRLDLLNAFDRYRWVLKLDDAPQLEAFDANQYRRAAQ